MKNLFVLLLWAVAGPCVAAPSVSEDEMRIVLNELDEQLDRRSFYHAGHDYMLDSLKQELLRATDSWKQYHLCGSLFYEYLHYQADSSLHYIDKKEEILPLLHRPDLQNEIYINRAEVLSVMGLYIEAQQELQRIRPMELEEGMRKYYYSVYGTLYNWLADYTSVDELRRKYVMQANCYRDSVLMLLPADVDRNIVFSEKLLLSHQPDEVIDILQKSMETTKDKKQLTYLHYTLSEAYGVRNDTLNQIYHLVQTVKLDMEMSVREYTALQKLAWLLYLKGDVKRAYHYMNCAMEDATECNARLRYVVGGKIYSIIDGTFREMEQQELHRRMVMQLVTAVLVVLLAVVVSCLVWWMKKLSDMRNRLAEANRDLEAFNKSLQEVNSIKDVYLARYLDRCVGYLERMEQYRRSLEKLAMALKTEELFKAIRSEQFLKDGRRDFYAEFDRSFLDLFPNFIEKFNGLLAEDEQVYPKQGELLSTELRIFALIRLGVTDTNRIAHFLGCSLTTVYNYRSKMRNRARGDKDAFEEQVMKL